jgi:hypothetical protein
MLSKALFPQVVRETLPALQELKVKGLVHHVGITGLPLNIFKYVIDRAPPGGFASARLVLFIVERESKRGIL